MPDNTDMPKFVQDDQANQPAQRWRPGLEPIQMFEEAGTVTLQIEILEESYRDLIALMRVNDWGNDEALTTVFLAGLGFQTAKWHLDSIGALARQNDPALLERVDTMVNELASYHSMYSVLKFKAFKLYKMNQALDFNNSGLRAQEDLWHEWAARMRRDKEELQAEVMRLRSLLAEFKLDWDSAGNPPLPPSVNAAADLEQRAESVDAGRERAENAGDISPAVGGREGLLQRLRRIFK